MPSLPTLLSGSPYLSYSYSYPHKSAYRPLATPRPLQEVWANEDKRALFLYAHIPFCEMRCGFCNLFTMAKPQAQLQQEYVQTLRAQAIVTREALGPDARFVRVALGGGTPSLLDDEQLAHVLDTFEQVMGADLQALPFSVEVSPETTTSSKMALLKARGVDRLSIGVQSFIEEETQGARRPQKPEVLAQALKLIKNTGFRLFNLDLIYGLLHQTPKSWQYSLERAVDYGPEEIFLYPLYVRPLTGLGNSSKSWDDERLALYRQGRDYLRAQGYEQLSMRLFRKAGLDEVPAPVYCCQNDGMVGLGVGARSYTQGLHYSSDYAVGRRKVISIIEDYISRKPETLSMVNYGFTLDKHEQRRRFTIISLLNSEGLSLSLYKSRFGTDVFDDIPELAELMPLKLASVEDDTLRLSELGMERSDMLGPWLYTPYVQGLSEEYELE